MVGLQVRRGSSQRCQPHLSLFLDQRGLLLDTVVVVTELGLLSGLVVLDLCDGQGSCILD